MSFFGAHGLKTELQRCPEQIEQVIIMCDTCDDSDDSSKNEASHKCVECNDWLCSGKVFNRSEIQKKN